MEIAQIELPDKLIDLFAPRRGELRYRVAYGGRGSGKSYSFALMAAIWGAIEPLRILCTREFQVSIKESMMAEIKLAISSIPWLAAHYEIGESFIKGSNGTEFIFRGLRHNISAIKSMSQIDLCIVEEAADVPQHSWQSLLPTIRAPQSELWVIYNPKNDTDPCDVMFRQNTPPRCIAVEINWQDNPWFPAELEEQRRHALEVMGLAEYAWIWDGAYLANSDAQIFAGKTAVRSFEPGDNWDGPYFGGDFGFSQDPTFAIEAWVHDGRVWLRREAHKVGLELDDTAAFITKRIPGFAEQTSRWDSARPESISFLKRHGLPRITAVHKWPGSVEDGIQFLRSFSEIVIHPDCTEMQKEARLYSYKVDRLTGDVTNKIVDAHNHGWDAVRYAVAPMIKRKGSPSVRVL